MDILRQTDGNPIFDFDLEPLSWESIRPSHPSSWHGHVAFAHWIVNALRPSAVVELGTHNGISFSAFCNSVKRSQIKTRCFAVDTWDGDGATGYYGEVAYADLRPFVAENFSAFAALLRCTFDEALSHFPDASIDLLHIDGLHTYEAIKHDFETWLPKISSRGVVLFHDLQKSPTSDGYGLNDLWAELCSQYRGFSFIHSNGLSVLRVGGDVPASVSLLCEHRESEDANIIRKTFEQASILAQQNGVSIALDRSQQKLQNIAAGRNNLAFGKPAIQSSYNEESDNTPSGAVNGIKTGRYGFHTKVEWQPWWMLDLGESRQVSEIVIYNRLDEPCPERARNLVVQVSNNGADWADQYVHDGLRFGGADGLPLRIRCYRTHTRFIRIYLHAVQYLHLDEVEVYAEPPPE